MAAAALLLVMVGTDAAPAETRVGESTVVGIRPLQPIPAATLPTENGVPVLPAWDGTPRRFVFETVTEATR